MYAFNISFLSWCFFQSRLFTRACSVGRTLTQRAECACVVFYVCVVHASTHCSECLCSCGCLISVLPTHHRRQTDSPVQHSRLWQTHKYRLREMAANSICFLSRNLQTTFRCHHTERDYEFPSLFTSLTAAPSSCHLHPLIMWSGAFADIYTKNAVFLSQFAWFGKIYGGQK